jgi:hypothetical protein
MVQNSAWYSICLTLSLRLKKRRQKVASTQKTAPPHVSTQTHADSSAQTDLNLSHSATRLRAYAVRLRSSVTVSAWLLGHVPQASQLVRRGVGLAGHLLRHGTRMGSLRGAWQWSPYVGVRQQCS